MWIGPGPIKMYLYFINEPDNTLITKTPKSLEMLSGRGHRSTLLHTLNAKTLFVVISCSISWISID